MLLITRTFISGRESGLGFFSGLLGNFITRYVKNITKAAGFLLKSRTVLLQNVTVITNVTTLLQNIIFFTKYFSTDLIMFYCKDVLLHRCYNANYKGIRFVLDRFRTIM